MKKNWLLWSAVAIGAFLIYKKMKKDTTDSGRELAPPPVAPNPRPSVSQTENTISEEI